MAETVQAPPSQTTSLSFKNLFNHFFLLHDFFHKLTKMRAPNADFFDLQIQTYNGMKGAVSTGSKATQFVAFSTLCFYYMKGKRIYMKFLYGFLFMYWYNHIITMGSYIGVLCRLPKTYSNTQNYYKKHPEQRNYLNELTELMNKTDHFEQTQLVLQSLFGSEDQQKSFVANEFFVKNKDKYLPQEVLQSAYHNDKKLKYLDSFLSRYVYYSFMRWCQRMGEVLSLETNNQ